MTTRARMDLFLLRLLLVLAATAGLGSVARAQVGCCVLGNVCFITPTANDCTNFGGTYSGVGFCTPNPCENRGACCNGVACSFISSAACTTVAGQFLGIGTACTPVLCLTLVELTDPDLPALSEGEYADGELVWTFNTLDLGGIQQYFTLQPDGPHVQVFSLMDFPDVGQTVAHTSTPECRQVYQCIGFDPSLGFPTSSNPLTNQTCPTIGPPPPSLGIVAIEPNYLYEQYGRANRPNDTAFASQWPLDNRGRYLGYFLRDANGNGQYDAAEGVYQDVNQDLVKQATDQLIRGAAANNGDALIPMPPNVGWRTWANPAGGSWLVFYLDADTNGRVSTGDTRITTGGLIIKGAASANGSVVAGGATPDGDNIAAATLEFTRRGTIDADIDAPQAWVKNTDCDGFVIAVIDSGSDMNNLDLRDNLWVRGGGGANQQGVSFIQGELHSESVTVNGLFDTGELVYLDVDGSLTVTVGDQRLSNGGAGLGVGPVAAGDADLMRTNPANPAQMIPMPLVQFIKLAFTERFVDLNNSTNYDNNEPIYLDRNFNGQADLGDVLRRGANVPFPAPLANFPADHKYWDNNGDGLYTNGEPIYRDTNGNNIVDAAAGNLDIRLTPLGPLGVGAVAAGNADVVAALPLTVFRATPAGRYERHIDVGPGAAGEFEDGEGIVDDRDNDRHISVGDRRLTPVFFPPLAAPIPAGPVVAGQLDIGRGLVDFRSTIKGDSLQDVNGHGTWAASVIGARGNNARGIAGVCWKAKIMTVRVVGNSRNHTLDRMVASFKWIADESRGGIDVRLVNYSHGRSGPASFAEVTELSALDARKVLFVAAAGNAGTNNNPVGGIGNDYPSCYTVQPAIPNVMSIGASNHTDNRVFNFGNASVDMAAPGFQVPVLKVGGNGEIQFVNGTSFAAPYVVGILAQAMTLFPAEYAMANGHRRIRELVLAADVLDSRFGLSGNYRSGKMNAGRARMLAGWEYGDAPDPLTNVAGSYPTELASSGARHKDLGEEWLGKAANLPLLWFDPAVPAAPARMSDASPEFDAKNTAGYPTDPDGVPNITDQDAHDDGIEFLTPVQFSTPQVARSFKVRIFVDTENLGRETSDADSGRYTPGFTPGLMPPAPMAHPTTGVHGPTDNKQLWVNGWMDWNRDGDWADANEHILMLRIDPSAWFPSWMVPQLPPPAVSTGAVYTLTIPAPQQPANAMLGDTYARFRLSYGENAGQRFPDNNELFFTNFANPFTAPGAMYRDWSFAGGLPLPLNGGTPGRLWESLTTGTTVLSGVRGMAESGEVEDYKVTLAAACPADINGSGSVTVQDIFDFLGFYFAGDPRGDFNGVGGITVQDIFDFLAAYFAGCA